MSANKDYSLDIFSLAQAKGNISSHKKIDQLSTAQISFLSRALKSYFKYQEVVNGQGNLNPNIEDLPSFLEHGSTVDLNNIINFLEKESNQTSEPEKVSKQKAESDQNNIPAELESMVALYKQHQADLLDSEREHTVSDTVKNLRKAWLEREKHRLIYENANKQRQEQIDKEKERFFRQSVDSKRTYQETTANIRQVAEKLVTSYGLSLSTNQGQEALNKIIYATQTGSLDISNFNSLHIVEELISIDLGKDSYLKTVDNIVQDDIRNHQIDEIADDPYNIETNLYLAEREVETDFRESVKKFRSKISTEYIDFDTDQKVAKEESDRIINGLNKAIPNPRTLEYNFTDLDNSKEALEKAIYEDSLAINKRNQLVGNTERIQLRPNTTSNETRVSGALSQTGGNLSPTIVDLYSRGITPQKLNQIISIPGSKTLEILSKNKLVQKQVQKQLQMIHDSEFGKGVSKGLEKIKPLSDAYYRLSSTTQKILDPIGTTKDYLNKKIGQYAGKQIVKNTSNAAAQKFGKFILENGLKEGAKKFADAAAKKLLIEGAKAIGVQTAKVAGMAAADSTIAAAAVALGIPTAGLSLIIAAALIVVQIGYEITIGIIKKGWQEIKDALGITKEDDKESRRALLVGLAALAASAIVIKRSGRYFGIATKAALISAAGIIWLSLATIAVFLTLTFMVAPLLSTLVQFDSEEKVSYTPNGVTEESNNSECGWPIAGSYMITQGPEGTATHGTNKLQAIDIWGPDIEGKPVISSTDGKVVYAGVSGNYGNAVYIETTNSAGTFQVLYAHLSSISVSSSDTDIKKGQIIGFVGKTGGWSTAHIHFEYKGIDYNQCPAGGVKIPVGCATFQTCGEIMTGAISTIN